MIPRRSDSLSAVLVAFTVVAYVATVTSIAFAVALLPVALVRYLLSCADRKNVAGAASAPT